MQFDFNEIASWVLPGSRHAVYIAPIVARGGRPSLGVIIAGDVCEIGVGINAGVCPILYRAGVVNVF